MRFIVFRELKDVGKKVVDRIYPVANMKSFEFDKTNKVFKIRHTDDTWHTITMEDASYNGRVFENMISNIKDKIVFK